MKSKLSLILLLTCLFSRSISAQITDDFSDGNITANPSWAGDVSEFIVNSAGELQLMAPDAGNSLLMVQGNIPDSAVWLMDVRLEFSPSTSNLLRILLLSETNTLNGNGYYLELGENGNLDALRMYRQDNGVPVLIATGTSGLVGTDPVDIRLRVKRSVAGEWTADLAVGNGNFEPQFTVNDAQYAGGANKWFGYYCLYSATRKDKFFFDNLSILPDLPDTTPPQLISAAASSLSSVDVRFSEPLDQQTAGNAANFSISGGISVLSAAWNSSAPETVVLSVSPLSNGQSYTLSTVGIKDTAGNISGATGIGFLVAVSEQAEPFDIVINEFMADPSPSAGLPATAEWVEIINRSNKLLNLSSLFIKDAGGSAVALPDILLRPDSLLVLCSPTQSPSLLPFTSRVVGVEGFPSLNNDADEIIILDASNTVIDALTFTLDWHTEAAKKEGGWSLERINPDAICLGQNNWKSCPAIPGGSPGFRNFSFDDTPDTQAPFAIKATVINSNVVRMQFSEGLDVGTIPNANAYKISPDRAIQSASVSPEDISLVTLILSEPLATQTVYAITFPGGLLKDCAGNGVPATDSVFIGVPEEPAPGDIVINEVLFNPSPNGARFVEVYNRSKKIFNWRDFFIANYFDGTDIDVIGKDRLFFPGTYIVLTPVSSDIETRFEGVVPTKIITNSLPVLADQEGNVTLFWSAQGRSVTVDSFNYSYNYHNPFFTVSEREGLSLERIRVEGPTNTGENWTSAANKGTPTQPNSQLLPPVVPEGDEWLLLPKNRLSPNDDGTDDFLDIQYTLPGTGYAVTMTIFDSDGIPVKKIARQELLSTTGGVRWDGDADDGTRCRPGIHILFAEVFSPQGDVRRVKKVFSLVR